LLPVLQGTILGGVETAIRLYLLLVHFITQHQHRVLHLLHVQCHSVHYLFFEHANVELTANLKHLRSITFALTLANAKVTIRLSFSDQFRFGYKN
jgi:hypothetical protein